MRNRTDLHALRVLKWLRERGGVGEILDDGRVCVCETGSIWPEGRAVWQRLKRMGLVRIEKRKVTVL